MAENKIAIFQGKQIRKVLYEGQWWFSIIDVIEVLVGGDRPRKYWNDLKKKLISEGYIEVSEKIGLLKTGAFYSGFMHYIPPAFLLRPPA